MKAKTKKLILGIISKILLLVSLGSLLGAQPCSPQPVVKYGPPPATDISK